MLWLVGPQTLVLHMCSGYACVRDYASLIPGQGTYVLHDGGRPCKHVNI